MRRYLLVIVVFMLFGDSLLAQVDSAEVYRQLFEDDEQLDPIQDEEDDEEGKGIPIYVAIQPSLYLANNANANYYNGAVMEIGLIDRLVIQTIWDNPNNKRIIKDDLGLNDNQYDAVEFNESNFNYNMNYDIGFLIGFQAFFAVQPRFSILLGFDFVSLTTASYITISVPDYESPNPDINSSVIKMEVMGKEQRFVIDLGLHWILGKRDLKYYVEGGGNFLMAKATDNKFKTGESTWNLMRTINNNTAANTITSFTFGGTAGAGLFFKMNEDFAFEFGPSVGINNVEFPGYSGYFTNIQFNLRIIYLSKNNTL